MRLSVEDRFGDDKEKAELARRAIVLLDGKRVEACTLADEEQGYVERFVPSERLRGTFYTVWPIEGLFGKVRIVDPDDLSEVYLKGP
jgi:hypothetical protein